MSYMWYIIPVAAIVGFVCSMICRLSLIGRIRRDLQDRGRDPNPVELDPRNARFEEMWSFTILKQYHFVDELDPKAGHRLRLYDAVGVCLAIVGLGSFVLISVLGSTV